MTDLLDTLEISIKQSSIAEEMVPVHLLNVPAKYRRDPLLHDPGYIQLCKQEAFDGESLDKLIILITKHGGYSDLIVAADQFIYRKKDKLGIPLLTKKITVDEVREVVTHMYDADRYSAAYEPGKEVDEAYEIHQNQAKLPLRSRVNIGSFQTVRQRGLKITFRELPSIPPNYDDLNVCETIRKYATPRQGIVMVAGETGSGKTTLCAAILRSMRENPDDFRVILSYERPIEFVFNNINGISPIYQHTVGEFGDYKTFYQGLKNALRCSPEVIYIGEAREKETFETLPKIAASGHMGITTVHAKSVSAVFPRIADEVDPSASEGLIRQMVSYTQLVVYQWLAPKIGGGVVPLQEILVFTDEVREFILKNKGHEMFEAINHAVEQFGQPFNEEAKKALDAGLITKETYLKATLS